MELLITLILTLAATLAAGIILLAAGGIAALCGFGFGRFMHHSRWILLIPTAVIIYGTIAERNTFKVNEVYIESPDIPEAFDGYRIVHVSDIHLRSFQNRHKALARAVSLINRQNPDLIAFTGDLITMSVDETDGCMEILSGLHAADGVLSVMGNHDYLSHSREIGNGEKQREIERLRNIEKEAGWKLLENSHEEILRDSSCLSVIGIENLSANPVFPSYGDIAKASEGASSSFKILMSHDPSAWEAFIVGQTDIDLTLSGHTHDMQLALPGFSPSSLFYKQHKGLYSIGNQDLYVNIGLGETIFPARIGARPEITVIILKREWPSTDSGSIPHKGEGL